jgi:pimeloyl-ACP methyl ester carboxylesterase
VDWTTEPVVSRRVEETEFELKCEGRTVPGILWRPEKHGENGKLALLGHGGGHHKRTEYLLAVARWLARSHGIASFALDGPGHGARLENGQEPDFTEAWDAEETTDHIVADWRAALDEVQGFLGSGPVGYWGLSMGTMIGIPLIAVEPRIKVALLGLMGFWGLNRKQLRATAPLVTCPLRFLLQWDDEIIPRERGLMLFDALGSTDKVLHAHMGLHSAVPMTTMRKTTNYLASYLCADEGSA